MTLEEKFIEVVLQSKGPYTLYLSSDKGNFIRVEFRKEWDDGLESHSQIRIINPAMGISTAPRCWDHFIKSLEINKVTEKTLKKALDRRIESEIIRNNLERVKFEKTFGEDYVKDTINNKGKRSLVQEVQQLLQSLKLKAKPNFTIIDGGKE
tara:strand:- start:1835 stop:2290 length:456 start_codon:yes stop_codon:yes gene_type:complete